MTVWFEGTGEIGSNINHVKEAFENLGEFLVGVVSRMPGLTGVELMEQGTDFVILQTNEGIMKRTSIAIRIEQDRVVVESDEEYQAGAKVTTKAHFLDEFSAAKTGVVHRLVISDIQASGLLGFFYRRFGSSKMGNAFLNATKAFFEEHSL
jgi:hypothetical protein